MTGTYLFFIVFVFTNMSVLLFGEPIQAMKLSSAQQEVWRLKEEYRKHSKEGNPEVYDKIKIQQLK